MRTQDVATSNQAKNYKVSSDTSISASPNTSKEVELLTSFFELLSQIDQRLIEEDREYRNKYFSDKSLRKEK